jgi:hypothetical protein
MDKKFQKEILEQRRSILYNKELKNIDKTNTVRIKNDNLKYLREESEPQYLIIGDNNENILNCNSKKNQDYGNMAKENLFEQVKNSEPSIYDYENKEQKQITIDFAETKSNVVTKKNLAVFGVFIVLSYMAITALNDYIMITYFQN